MIEKDLKVVADILLKLGFSSNYIPVLLNHLTNKLKEYGKEEFTPTFLYTILLPEIGRRNSRELSDYFDQYKSTGSFKTHLEDLLSKSPWMK